MNFITLGGHMKWIQGKLAGNMFIVEIISFGGMCNETNGRLA
jgi:hypothetical protein